MEDLAVKEDTIRRALADEQGVEATAVSTALIDGKRTEIVLVEAAPYVSLIELRVRAMATGLFNAPPAILISRKLRLPVETEQQMDELIRAARTRDDLLLFSPPANEQEAKLIAFVERLLDLQPVGAMDDFFQIGVDSLAAIQLAMFVDESWPGRVEAHDVLTCGNVRMLAKSIQ